MFVCTHICLHLGTAVVCARGGFFLPSYGPTEDGTDTHILSHHHLSKPRTHTQRAYVGKFEKLLTLPYSWLKTISG